MAAFDRHKGLLVQAMNSLSASQPMDLAEFESRFFPDSLQADLAMNN
jgi:hypothetical protein